jgi:glycerol-3-phosphate acyltransferase PlsY
MSVGEVLALVARLLICFAIGSIPFAVLAMKGSGINITKVGSRNPGFNNVLRFSKRRAVLTLLGDLGKGLVAILLFRHPGDPMTLGWIYGFAVILGHCYSPWLKFNGGKGIATSAGIMLVLYPLWATISLVLFTILRVTGARLKWTEAGTIASLGTWVFFTVMMFLFVGRQDGTNAALMTMFLAWRHKSNFQILVGAAQPQQ